MAGATWDVDTPLDRLIYAQWVLWLSMWGLKPTYIMDCYGETIMSVRRIT